MPGAFEIPGPGPFDTTTAATTGADYVDPLHVTAEEEEGGEEESTSVGTETSVDIEVENQQPSAQQTSSIVSAYRVAEQEPIIATPLKDNRVRILMYGFLVTAAVALIVGLSVGLTTQTKDDQPSFPVDRLVSSANVTADQAGEYLKANRYITTQNGKETTTSTGSAVINYCEVIPCYEGGCDISQKVYKPGCCRGADCPPSEKCGFMCPSRANLCHPSFEGCRDASCYECERGPNGEELYRRRSASFNINCLRTGVATGFNDKNDSITRIYKWAIVCGFNVRGGNHLQNYGPGEYICIALRSGNGITKTVSIPVPCQLIQYGECGCGPEDMHTLGLPPPIAPCRTTQDCRYLCGDAGEEQAKKLCEVFPGIEWWEGENPLYQFAFVEPEEEFFGNITVQIEIHEE